MTTPRPRRHSPKVYRRRRAVLLLGLLAVVVVVLLIILKPGSGSGSPSVGNQQAAVPNASTSPTGGSAPDVAGAAAPEAAAGAATDGAATDGSAACAAGNITVTAITDASSYAAGSLPQLSFSIVNTGSSPCTINAGTSKQVYTITSGTEVYWLSTDCQSDPSDTPAMLEPGVVVTSTPFAWNRVRSSPSTCSGTQAAVPAGGASYHLTVSVDGIASAATTQFILT
ncbi:hypothetical protein B7R54_15200 [Subtercola boreus]|uniref:DUF4232 domain-containing protein n=1 Tax=Subtercola boreus TaxID=120213 RepID=A0A3E0VKB0_9MICO|nr:hypothetical protein [Subtercola boreus]RFA10402.1 hypothetical protein B7R54_15200 [Subtercola boreus]TQL56079.1 hypothetical protein FB464_3659 [Subtercola boreus]